MSNQAFGDTWVTKASMPTARGWLAAGVVNGLLYAVGGTGSGGSTYLDTVEAYDPTTDTWATEAPMLTPRCCIGAGVVNGLLYAVGGVNSSSNALATVEAYDPVANTWLTKASMPTARGYPAAGVVDGLLYAVGGCIDNPSVCVTATVEAYNPATNTWTTKAPMPTARYALAAIDINGLLYAVGGWNGTARVATVEAYDPGTNTWTTKASMPTPRSDLGVGVVNGLLYAVGGYNNGPLTTVEVYDPATNTWTTKAPMPAAVAASALSVVNGILYAVGGWNGVDFLATVQAYTPDATLAPTADFTTTPNPAQAGQSVAFDALASHDNDSVGCDPTTNTKHCIVSYAWAFGDSATQTTSAPTTSHTYSAAGAYTATLTVTDNDGQTASLQHVTQVSEPPGPPPGCNMVGHAHGNQNFKATVNGKTVNVHVEVDGDCDYDKKADKVFLHRAKVHVTVGNGPPLIQAKQDDKHSDVSSVTLTSATATEPPKAVIMGTWGGSPFTVALTDGGKGNKNDTVQVTYPGFPASTLSAPHADVHIEFK